ncbi:MAG: glycerophosphodiester phosphodiesterase [Betaproteobacteria bacterium]|nr:glycerophosphodiester phosphodiesterase [Betaproteobacteria bacterium]
MNRLQVVAHRGSSALWPENTWPAFDAAVSEGADAIEFDVHRTRDGVLVIRHDLTIGERLVADCTAAELETMEPGLVRVADMLAWAARKNVELLVELKDPDAALPLGDMIAASPWRERLVVGGFHGPALAAVKARAPGIATSLMMGSVVGPDELIRLAVAYRTDGVHLCWESRAPRPHRLLDPAALARLRSEPRLRTPLARRARRRCGRWSRFAPTPSAPTRRRCCGASSKRIETFFQHRGSRPRHTGGQHHVLETRSIGNRRRRAVRRRGDIGIRRRRSDQGVVARGPFRAAARQQPGERGRHAQQDARGNGHRQARQDRSQRIERQGL